MQVKQYSTSKKEAMLRQADELLANGLSTSKIIKQLGIASPTYYAWRKQRKNGTTYSSPIEEVEIKKNGGKDLAKENSLLRNLIVNMALELNQLKGF